MELSPSALLSRFVLKEQSSVVFCFTRTPNIDVGFEIPIATRDDCSTQTVEFSLQLFAALPTLVHVVFGRGVERV